MALNIKDPETERLAAELARMMGTTKTAAVRTALRDAEARLQVERGAVDRERRLRRFLTAEAWPQIPDAVRGVEIPKAEHERILGYGPEGV